MTSVVHHIFVNTYFKHRLWLFCADTSQVKLLSWHSLGGALININERQWIERVTMFNTNVKNQDQTSYNDNLVQCTEMYVKLNNFLWRKSKNTLQSYYNYII